MAAVPGELCALADPVNAATATPTVATTSAVLFMNTSPVYTPLV
jgi:hypothetical protein